MPNRHAFFVLRRVFLHFAKKQSDIIIWRKSGKIRGKTEVLHRNSGKSRPGEDRKCGKPCGKCGKPGFSGFIVIMIMLTNGARFPRKKTINRHNVFRGKGTPENRKEKLEKRAAFAQAKTARRMRKFWVREPEGIRCREGREAARPPRWWGIFPGVRRSDCPYCRR